MDKELVIDDQIISSHEIKENLKNAPQQTYFSTKMPCLDELIGGFGEGDFIVVGGAQKAGKSLLLASWTKSLVAQGVPCLWFQIELPYREFIGRWGENLPMFYLPKVLSVPTLTWIEGKIDEAIKKFKTKVVFIDHLGMLADEKMFMQRNSVDIFDSRLQFLKRMAIRKNICIVGVNPFVSSTLRKKSTEMDTSDFRGTAMIGYYADTLLGVERLAGVNKTKTAQDIKEDAFGENELLISTDMYVYVLDCRRTGARKIKIKCKLDESGMVTEY